jgi:hypothetical protein
MEMACLAGTIPKKKKPSPGKSRRKAKVMFHRIKIRRTGPILLFAEKLARPHPRPATMSISQPVSWLKASDLAPAFPRRNAVA